jgi:uncharacterized protein
MKFLDANVFVYAYYKPRKPLTEKERQMKEQAKKIIADVSKGKEEVLMTVVHVSEVANILKHGLPQEQLMNVLRGLFMLDNLKIVSVSRDQYFAAVELGEDLRLDSNDALAVDMMQQNGGTEIYSFDEHFAHVDGILKLP